MPYHCVIDGARRMRRRAVVSFDHVIGYPAHNLRLPELCYVA